MDKAVATKCTCMQNGSPAMNNCTAPALEHVTGKESTDQLVIFASRLLTLQIYTIQCDTGCTARSFCRVVQEYPFGPWLRSEIHCLRATSSASLIYASSSGTALFANHGLPLTKSKRNHQSSFSHTIVVTMTDRTCHPNTECYLNTTH